MSFGAIFGLIFLIDYFVKSFIFGCWLGEKIARVIYNHICKELDKCTYFGEDYVDSKK